MDDLQDFSLPLADTVDRCVCGMGNRGDTSNAVMIHGNCLELMQKMRPLSVDMVITDPPYGMSFQSNRSKAGPRHRKIAGDQSVDHRWLELAYRLLHDNGGMLSFCDWRTSAEWMRRIESAGFKIVSQVIWNRMHHGMGDLRGAFAPMHDVIWYAVKGRRTWSNGRPKSVISSQRPGPSEDHGHPTCKPLDLMLELCSKTGRGLVLDPFAGSGSTGVACASIGRPFVGMELDEGYYRVAERRITCATAARRHEGAEPA